ncbi:alpha/beta hydrolase [Henriciella sp.]|uniref:alpha/beta fold hydrolase n=1 Tax=Henriciella sp. TaxID=1968823 RepID=UPI0017ECB294|nr:alpha/beta hydrolase [Henriciella sp.]HIG24197.1 alpha/beta hydrolase [Henriciella sp.]
MSDGNLAAKTTVAGDMTLARYGGEKPAAPEWFNWAIAQEANEASVEVDGAKIAYRSWGDPSKPGLLLAHGNGAHARWWDFIAPFLATDYYVVAPTFSGMGDSDWRKSYSFPLFSREQHAVCEHAGLFDHAEKPIIVSHSFGGIISLFTTIAEGGDKFGGAVIVDSHLEPPGDERPRPPRRTRANRTYSSFNEALARFRLAPPQPCENDYIVDYIARHSIREMTSEDGEEGYSWKFDPFIFNSLMDEWNDVDLTSMETRCPIVFMRGGLSDLVPDRVADYMCSLQDPPVPMITVPEAYHHVMLDQPLAFVSSIRGLLAGWPGRR